VLLAGGSVETHKSKDIKKAHQKTNDEHILTVKNLLLSFILIFKPR
jgi:hypothetical protein